MRRITLSSMLAAQLLLWPAQGNTLALSDIELFSYLNQPLNARVSLLAVEPEELNSLRVSLRQSDDPHSNRSSIGIRHEIKQDDRGYYIEIHSEKTVREPILKLSLELNWNTGQLMREYSLLIDPRSS